MIRLLSGDCRDVLPTLPAESVQCVVTSPPYYGLRDYGTALWDGGDAGCDHKRHVPQGAASSSTFAPGHASGQLAELPYRDTCGKCGAVRVDRQIGLEATPDAYLATMVGVFREVRRVLRRDGTCWVNMGDSYAGSPTSSAARPAAFTANGGTAVRGADRNGMGAIAGAKPKDLLLMPARLALALQADGWWIRSDVIWHKPNPMPESCTDRPTNAHEHVFLLTKAARYFYDADAVREEAECAPQNWSNRTFGAKGSGRDDGGGGYAVARADKETSRNLRNVWTIATHALSSAFSDGSYRIASQDCAVHDRQVDLVRVLECDAQQDVFPFGRNPGKRSRPAELPEGAVVSIPVDRSEFPVGVTSAIGRSSQNHRMPVLSERDVIFGDIPGGHTECRALLDHSFAMFARKPASNTSEGASLDGRLTCQSVEIPDRIVGIATYEPRPDGCNCYYAGTVHKRQDHFASFPPELAERCIKAGTSERGACSQCGKPWVRVTETPAIPREMRNRDDDTKMAFHTRQLGGGQKLQDWRDANPTTTTGWSPGCQCDAATVPCTVLDPFIGAGTTALVADRLQRDAIGIDLNTQYTRMAMDRCIADAPLFTSFPPAEPPEDERMADLFTDLAAD